MDDPQEGTETMGDTEQESETTPLVKNTATEIQEQDA